MPIRTLTLKNLNATLPASIPELSNMVLGVGPNAISIAGLFSLQQVANATSLQALINSGRVELMFDGIPIPNLNMLCQEKAGVVTWLANFTLPFAGASTSVLWSPGIIPVPYNSRIISYASVCSNGSALSTLQISTDNGQTWANTSLGTNLTCDIIGRYATANVLVLEGNLLRLVRNFSTGTATNCSFDFLLKRA